MRVFVLLSVAMLLAGCASQPAADPSPPSAPSVTTPASPASYQAMGFDGTTWPRLDGVTLTILDHGAFGAFDGASAAFENLTGARVVHVAANDAGSALSRAVLERGAPTFDVIYGIDNILWTKALSEGIFEPYTPILSQRVQSEYVFFDGSGAWPATPVDHGFIGVNVDTAKLGGSVATLQDITEHAGTFVTQDPRTSTPGLGFLLATIATFPDVDGGPDGGRAFTWKDYWSELFRGGVLVTSGWTEAYEQHFSGGYGADYGGAADKAIVTSYTGSPAYESFFGRAAEALATPLVAPQSTFHQIETMGIAKGTKQLVAAQAWIEFTLTDSFQNLTAPSMAVYPVVAGIDVAATFGGVDPAPGSFEPAAFTADEIGRDLEKWLREWTDLCEAHNCA